jgi:hypothetical protein
MIAVTSNCRHPGESRIHFDLPFSAKGQNGFSLARG